MEINFDNYRKKTARSLNEMFDRIESMEDGNEKDFLKESYEDMRNYISILLSIEIPEQEIKFLDIELKSFINN